MSTYVYPSVLFQGLTFTAKRWGQFPTISYTTGAVAGSEVVTTTSANNIVVQVATGVSTRAQVKAAIDATAGTGNGLTAGDLVSIVVTTPGTVTAPATSSAMTGATAPNYLGFYSDQTITPLTSTFQAFMFASVAKFLTLENTESAGTDTIVYSWDGVNNHGKLAPSQSTLLEQTSASVIFLKFENAAPDYKLMVKTA